MLNLLELEINRVANNGKGVAVGADGKTVFVDGAVPGDQVVAEVTADRPRYAEARIVEVLRPSPCRIEPDCPVLDSCGGCCFRQMTYEAELVAKAGFVRDAFRRIGGFELIPEPILASPLLDAYRNKVEFAVSRDVEGQLFAGFYSEKTHRVIPVTDCRIIPEEFVKILDNFFKNMKLKESLTEFSLDDGGTVPCFAGNRPFLHHIVMRKSGLTGEIMLILVAASEGFHGDVDAAEQIRKEFPQITSVILNVNRTSKGPVLGPVSRVLSGSGFIRDQICGVPVEIGPLSFFQVNTPAAEALYRTAAEFADVQLEDTVLDLYCGMGTIGLSMASDCRQLIGGEIIPEAVESARRNAAAMGLDNARFLCGDAADIARTLISEGCRSDLIILDPPRKGCSPETLRSALTLAPEQIVMVSCDPATAARDCRTLADAGYSLTRIRPVDLFPRTKHVECIVFLQMNN